MWGSREICCVLALAPLSWRGLGCAVIPRLLSLWLLVCGCSASAQAEDPADGWKLFRSGDYAGAIISARAAREGGARSEEAWRLEAEALLIQGKYTAALAFFPKALRVLPSSIRLRLLLREAELQTGHQAEAADELQQIATIANGSARYLRRDSNFLPAAGEAALIMGVEPRLVLDNFLRPAQRATPPSRDAFLIAGKLAVDKHDYALASRTFQEGLQLFADDPDLWFGLASSFLNGDRTKLAEYAAHALALNPKHLPTLLLVAENLIDTEDYPGAQHQLAQVRQVNSRRPEALALLAVVAHLQNDEASFNRLREEALASWKTNPAVDHLIGRKLSQKYRFAEGAASQRRALALDPTFAPARMQLAEDLLRLGRDEEGWAMATQAHDADPYDVTAYNLVTLRDQLGKFTTLTTPHFRLRMSTQEAAIYGPRALALLEQARERLTAKYGLDLTEQVTVEIYPDPKDFAVRTFGMPGRPGYLGVCFGPVVTVNSPATQRANWESVLWHEFCHVITLTLTRNRMPRWLSEGISVYEESQANPSWGRPMSLGDRTRILGGKMRPIQQMSAAFLQAESQEDVLFAYSESALVVQFIVERYGFDAIKALLGALRDGTEVNVALARHVAPLDDLEKGFVPFAQAKAEALGGGYDLTPPSDGVKGMVTRLNPKNLPVQLQGIQELIDKKEWAEAKTKLVEVTRRAGYVPGEYNAHALLAQVCAALNDREGERAAWLAIAEHESDALSAVSRLLALAEQTSDWSEVTRWSNQWLAINPLAAKPWRALLEAGEKRGATTEAIAAGRTLLLLAPTDAAVVHYKVARLLQSSDGAEARKHVLLALAEAPRYRAAYDLLNQLPSQEKP